jgi:dTMP kinase
LLLEGSEERWSPRAEALLFAAARTAHVDHTIRPALARGEWVLCDRFLDSSLAYQGGAGGLGIEQVRAINLFGIEGCLPDRTLLLCIRMAPSGRGRATGGGRPYRQPSRRLPPGG